jgi:hypothetical protein
MIISIFKPHDPQDVSPGAPPEQPNQSLANFFPLC